MCLVIGAYRADQGRLVLVFSDRPPAMIPPVKLGLLALGLAGWPLELEDDTRGSYAIDSAYTAYTSSRLVSSLIDSHIVEKSLYFSLGTIIPHLC